MKTCLKCGKQFDENTIEDSDSAKYPSCNLCWKEWTTYAVIVINEMRLDMSLPEHRKALRKYERIFFGLDKEEEPR
jgi:Fe-S cluster biosynthesis and repair protein YggX